MSWTRTVAVIAVALPALAWLPAARAVQADAKPSPAAGTHTVNEWVSRVNFKGDIRYRRENIDNEALADDRLRDTLRARFGATIRVNDTIDAEFALASGRADPRGASTTLGGASSRKDIGLDLAYITWRTNEMIAVSAGKVRQPFVRPGFSAFFDNEIRPEGFAINYQNATGMFASAFSFWLEERAANADSMLNGAQVGWRARLDESKLMLGIGYYDYASVRGRLVGFGDNVVTQLGNSVEGEGGAARYVYDYDIGQLFAELSFVVARVPVTLFSDYARNIAADDGRDSAYSTGFVLGRADAPGRWEFGAFRQEVAKDALFGQWVDSDLTGVTDHRGQVYRTAWMALHNVVVNLTYIDASYDVHVGTKADYDRWQLDLNFSF